MKIKLLSDLHFEFHADGGRSMVDSIPADEVDVLVLAGDIAVGSDIYEAIGLFAHKFKKIIYVHGNHEYYSNNTKQTISDTKRATQIYPNVIWLNNDVTNIDGVRFVGTPLWFDRADSHALLQPYMQDFKQIEACDPWAFDQNILAKEFLNREVTEGSIVITHHLPTWASVHPKYAGSMLNCFFVCDMENLIIDRQPALWLHGHTHSSCNYWLYGTQILCNPFGYVAVETNPMFSENQIVDLDKR